MSVIVESNDINDEDELEDELVALLEQFDEHFEDTTLKVKTVAAFER